MGEQQPNKVLESLLLATQVPLMLSQGDVNELHKRSEAIANLAMLDVDSSQ